MKLIDILVEELPKLGGWPEDVEAITQDSDRSINNYRTADGLETNGCGTWRYSSAWQCYLLSDDDVSFLADDYTTAIITREQYEAALAAKNDGWIDWGGGECPVSDNAMVDVRYRDGQIRKAQRADSYEWGHGYAHFVTTSADIISYRLHQQQEAAQPKADEEADLNECIGHGVAPVWNGEGLPPVGCMCERSWAGDEWQRCKILFTSNQLVVVKLKESGREDAYNIGDVTFRPIRSEAERKRDAAKNAIAELCRSSASNGHSADLIYDAIAAGEVPGVKLED